MPDYVRVNVAGGSHGRIAGMPLEAAQDPDPGRNLEAFDTAICGHAAFVLNNQGEYGRAHGTRRWRRSDAYI